MSLKFFTIPIQDLASSEGELNSFMANHRVLSVDRHFVDHGASSFWTVCVDFLDGQPATSSDSRTRRAKVDYRDLLDPEEFTVFAKLRDLRKEISQEGRSPGLHGLRVVAAQSAQVDAALAEPAPFPSQGAFVGVVGEIHR